MALNGFQQKLVNLGLESQNARWQRIAVVTPVDKPLTCRGFGEGDEGASKIADLACVVAALAAEEFQQMGLHSKARAQARAFDPLAIGLILAVHVECLAIPGSVKHRSEERRVGKECRSRWS